MDKSQKRKTFNIIILQKPEIKQRILKILNIIFKSLKYGRKRNQFHRKIVREKHILIKFLLV